MSKQLLKEPSTEWRFTRAKKLSACTEAHIRKNRNKQPVCWYYTPETLNRTWQSNNPACQLQVCFTKTDRLWCLFVSLSVCSCKHVFTELRSLFGQKQSRQRHGQFGGIWSVHETPAHHQQHQQHQHPHICHAAPAAFKYKIHKNPFWTLQELKKNVVWLRWGGQTEEPNSWKSK